MAFTLDFENKFDGSIKDGEYEAVIYMMAEDVTPSGAVFVNVNMIIRNDVEQPHKNQHIFHRIFQAKATGKYNMMMFNTIGFAAGLTNGKQYSSFEELLDDYVGKPVRVRVKNEDSEYNGKTYTNLNVKNWDKTKVTGLNHQWKEAPRKASDPANQPFTEQVVSDDDLPF